ncbi:MAG: tetratricopeptide repeat protein, partial [Chloroflexota bacterium]
RQTLAMDPAHPDALHLLGLALFQRGQAGEAVEVIRLAVASNPEAAVFHLNLAVVYEREGRLDEAAAELARCLERMPDEAAARFRLALIQQRRDRPTEAAEQYRRLLELRPDHADGLHNLGLLLQEQGQAVEAVAVLERLVALLPESVAALNNLGQAYLRQGRPAPAAATLERALAIDPGRAEVRLNLGSALQELGDPEQAEGLFREALRTRPDLPEAHFNLGNALRTQGRPEDAAGCYEEALRLDPAHAESHYNLGLSLLQQGDVPRGWEEYEWRWRVPGLNPGQPEPPAPAWDGRPLAGGRLLVMAEQGLGDTIQFVRYLPLAARACRGPIVLQCQPELRRLLRDVDGADEVAARGERLPPCSAATSLMSLPRLLAGQATIPASVPYLRPEPPLAATWRRRLATHAGAKVGVVWAGSPGNRSDASRSLPAAALRPLAEVRGVSLFSLQKGDAAAEASALGPSLTDLAPHLTGFADTAAAVSQLDLVVSVDTSVAHLAGALGKPVWLLLAFAPDWRWLLGRADSPWYPTARLFRQPQPGRWEAPVRQAAEALSELAARDRSSRPPSTLDVDS